jgi:hypothetical protein
MPGTIPKMGPIYQLMAGQNNKGILRCALLALASTRERASVTKIIPWNAISHLDRLYRLSVHIVLGRVLGLAVNTSFVYISAVLVIPLLVIGFQFLTVMVIPSVIGVPISRESINSFMVQV